MNRSRIPASVGCTLSEMAGLLAPSLLVVAAGIAELGNCQKTALLLGVTSALIQLRGDVRRRRMARTGSDDVSDPTDADG
ncbi:hypothetical protein Pen02_24170 [Plantactinospora endophytica]|uniref:Uncharacterized protein n=3 Tax=Plantactinospora endophytica TaxID=673535 RepID=A0ABQ4DZI9_9ACTN|nr:hypothetical protein Pen02_24170 [Plantactinospora endophytica]